MNIFVTIEKYYLWRVYLSKTVKRTRDRSWMNVSCLGSTTPVYPLRRARQTTRIRLTLRDTLVSYFLYHYSLRNGGTLDLTRTDSLVTDSRKWEETDYRHVGTLRVGTRNLCSNGTRRTSFLDDQSSKSRVETCYNSTRNRYSHLHNIIYVSVDRLNNRSMRYVLHRKKLYCSSVLFLYLFLSYTFVSSSSKVTIHSAHSWVSLSNTRTSLFCIEYSSYIFPTIWLINSLFLLFS